MSFARRGRRAAGWVLSLLAVVGGPAAASPSPRGGRPSGSDRAEALWRIARSGRPDAEVVLVEAAQDGSALVRRTAMHAIARAVRRPADETRRALREALGDPHPLVVLAAARALQVHLDPGAAAALSKVVCRPPRVRAGHELPAIEGAAARTTEWEIAGEALQALRGTTGWRSDPAILVNLLGGGDPEARLAAALAAADSARGSAAGGRAKLSAALRGAMAGPSRRVRLAAAAALAHLGDARGSGLLVEWLRRPPRPRGERHRAATALEKITGRDWAGRSPAAWDAADPRVGPAAERRIQQIEACLKARGLATTPPDVVPKKLAPADRALLDRLFALGLLDPRGRELLGVRCLRRTAWGALAETNITAWGPSGPAGQGRRLYQTWGRPVRRAKQAREIPSARRGLAGAVGDVRLSMRPRETSLVLAAWAYRLGQRADAARLLLRAREEACGDDELLDGLRREAARGLLLDAVHAYMVCADEEALEAAERLVRVGGRYADAFGPGGALLAELRRRRAAGTFGKRPPPLPTDLAQRPVRRRVAVLIAALEDVAVRQETQPGGIDLAADRRVMGLIEIGDAAVGALIECIAGDRRLTRSVHFRRDFLPERWPLGVREAALVAAQSILRRSFFRPEYPADNFTRRGPVEAAAVARRLGDYWRAHGDKPLPRRQMDVLTDPAAGGGELRVAAKTLAALGGRAVFGTMVGTSRLVKRGRGPSPAVGMFADPTAAEAILAAMDRDLAAFDRGVAGCVPRAQGQRDRVEIAYVRALAALGDRRIADRLARRYRAAGSGEVRRALAVACGHLGRGDILRDFRAREPSPRPATPSTGPSP